jgi:hypothetical protein
MLGDGK